MNLSAASSMGDSSKISVGSGAPCDATTLEMSTEELELLKVRKNCFR